MLPTKVRRGQKAPAATLIWREGAHEVQLGGRPGPDAGVSSDRGPRARRRCPRKLRSPDLPADKRKLAYQGRGSGKKRPFAGYSGGGQPLVDHQYIGRKRLSRPVAGEPARQTAYGPGERIHRTTG